MPFSLLTAPSDSFPTYLMPSLPFRSRKSSTDSNASTSRSFSVSSEATSGSAQSGDKFLSGHESHLRCSRCLSDLALADQIVSKGFTGRHGRAYLVAPSTSAITPIPLGLASSRTKNDALPNLPNTFAHKPVPRQLVTGAHTVSDISCAHCGSTLGWKYVAADEESQRYKVGKFILETKRVCRSSTWDCSDGTEELEVTRPSDDRGAMRRPCAALPPNAMPSALDGVEFDSQDEDECEDLFTGAWTPQIAAKRRRLKLQLTR